MGATSIRRYSSAKDGLALHSLWLRTFDEKWLVEPSVLNEIFGSEECLVAEDGTSLVGFVGTVAAERSVGALLVDASCRRRGVGRALFLEALEVVKRHGASKAVIGGLPQLWKGIPHTFEPALAFAEKLGCTFVGRTWDQFRYLRDFEYPLSLEARLNEQGIRLGLGTAEDEERVCSFERRHFPAWAQYFEGMFNGRDHVKVVLAQHEGRVVATALLGPPDAAFPGKQWAYLSRRPLGSVATLGVDPAYRGRGVGIGLFAFAANCLCSAGAEACFLNYSEAIALYEKLGFTGWAQYHMYERVL